MTNDISSFPDAAGVRQDWSDIPASIRVSIEERLGSRVVEARTQIGGFSPGVASRLRLADGTRAFVKAVSYAANPNTPGMHLREASVVPQLPAAVPAPKFLFAIADSAWAAIGLEEIDGHTPTLPWTLIELSRVVDAIVELTEILTPAPFAAPPIAIAHEDSFNRFRSLHSAYVEGLDALSDVDPWIVENLEMLATLESRWMAATQGDTLLHCDLRADNILVTADRIMFVDWPHVVHGADWFDLMAMLPSVGMQGGPNLEATFLSNRLGSSAPTNDVDAALCALAGYFVDSGRKTAPPGLPTLRPFQQAQGIAAITWLRERLDSRD